MMSIAKISPGQADYYTRLQNPKYYMEGGEPPGDWTGQGSEVLALSGQVQREAFANVFNGLSPDGTRPLTQRQKYVTPHAGCGKVRQRQVGWDVVFSVPKHVSVAAAIGPQELRHKIETVAIPRATQKAITYLQDHAAFTRRGQGGRRRERAKLIIAAFPHTTSRAMDPQLHVHHIFMSSCVREDGTTGTLESRPLFEHKMAAGAVFRAALAEELEQLGFRCSPARHGFKIDGIPDELCNHFSKRRNAIVERLAQLGQSSAVDAARAALATRRGKGIVPPREQLLRLWQAEAECFGVTPDLISEATKPDMGHGRDFTDYPDMAQVADIVDSAADVATAKKDAFTCKDVIPHVLDASIGSDLDVDAAIAATEDRLGSGSQYIRLSAPVEEGEAVYTTRQVKDRQSGIAAWISRVQGDRSFVVPERIVKASISAFSHATKPVIAEMKYHASQFAKAARREKTNRIIRPLVRKQASHTLNSEGRALVRKLTQAPGRITVISQTSEQRSTALRASVRAWKKAGYEVITCSPFRRATRKLEQLTGASGMTYRKLQLMMHPTFGHHVRHFAEQFARAAVGKPTFALDGYRIDRKKVLILDHADRLTLKELSQLTRDVQRQGGKLVLLTADNALPHMRSNMTARLLHDVARRTIFADVDRTVKWQMPITPQHHQHNMEIQL